MSDTFQSFGLCLLCRVHLNPVLDTNTSTQYLVIDRKICFTGYLGHGTATDYMYDRLKVPLAFTWEIYGDNEAHFNDCFRMFNPVTPESFDRVIEIKGDNKHL